MKLMRAVILSFLISSITFLPSLLIPAQAITRATAYNSSGTLAVSSGTFILYATTSPTGANPGGPLTLSKTANDQFFYLRNTGTLDIAGFNLTITTSPLQTFTLSRCALNVAFTAANTCATGSPTTVTISGGVVSLTVPANSWYAIDFAPKKSTTPTISVSVSSAQIRAATTTNS